VKGDGRLGLALVELVRRINITAALGIMDYVKWCEIFEKVGADFHSESI
jgi:hypothetical protein